MSSATIIQALVSGALVGVLYAMSAVGFSLVLRVSRALNLAHGDLIVLGGYAGYAAWVALGWHPLLLLPLAAAALLPLAWLWDRLVARLPPPVELTSCVLTFGLSLLLQNAMTVLWSGQWRLLASPALAGALAVGDVRVGAERVAAASVAVAALAGAALGLRFTRPGRAIRALGVNREAAALSGIDVVRGTRLAFMAGTALAGAAGVLFATLHYLHPAAGTDLTLLAITLGIWAGTGGAGALCVAGLALGIGESLTLTVAGTAGRDVAVALVLLGSLLARGGALTGTSRR